MTDTATQQRAKNAITTLDRMAAEHFNICAANTVPTESSFKNDVDAVKKYIAQLEAENARLSAPRN